MSHALGGMITPKQRQTHMARKAERAQAEALLKAGKEDEDLKQEHDLFVPQGGLCPMGWCFVASVKPEHGDVCRSCRDYVSGSNEGAWVCPSLCRPTGSLEAPFCQMADLLREDIMPSEHFGDAGLFPCRVGNDLQRSQAAPPTPEHQSSSPMSGLALLQKKDASAGLLSGASKKRAKHRLTEGSRKKMAKKAEERAREAALIAEEEKENSHQSALSQGEGRRGSMTGHAAPTRVGQLMPAGWIAPPQPLFETLPPLPPPLLPDPPTPFPTPPPAPPFSLGQFYRDLGLTRLDEILLLFIGVLACVLGSVLWPKLKSQIDEWRETWASVQVQQQRRDARLHRISDVAKEISLGLDATLAHTQSLSASYDYSHDGASDFWTSEAAPFVGATRKDANA